MNGIQTRASGRQEGRSETAAVTTGKKVTGQVRGKAAEGGRGLGGVFTTEGPAGAVSHTTWCRELTNREVLKDHKLLVLHSLWRSENKLDLILQPFLHEWLVPFTKTLLLKYHYFSFLVLCKNLYFYRLQVKLLTLLPVQHLKQTEVCFFVSLFFVYLFLHVAGQRWVGSHG